MFGSGVHMWLVLSKECTVSIDFFHCFEGTLQCLDALKGTREKARALEGAAVALMFESLGDGPLCACSNWFERQDSFVSSRALLPESPFLLESLPFGRLRRRYINLAVISMRNKFGSLLGRSLKASKFKPLVSLAISRLAVLKNQRRVRFSQARSDVLQLLQLGNHDRALLRVEHVIKEQNMLDVYDMIEKYCNLLIERTHLIEHERECPEELREAISGLLFAASRCGDFPELHEIRAILTSQFGKEFAARAVELRNNCGVNLTMIQKLSTRQPSLENRMTVLKEIAAENSIVLQLDEAASFSTQEKTDVQKNQHQPAPKTGLHILPEDLEDGKFSGKYKDVADAAQAAFESAAFAAAAARAAVELSRIGHDSDSQDSPRSRQGKSADRNEPMQLESELEEEKIPVENQMVRLKRSSSSSSSDDMNQANPSGKDVVFDDSDSETVEVKNNTSASDMKTPPRFQAGLKADSIHQHSREKEAAGSEGESEPRLNLEKGPYSVRTWRLRGY